MKMQDTDWKTVFFSPTFHQGVLPCTCKLQLKFSSKEMSSSVRKWAKDLNRYVTK